MIVAMHRPALLRPMLLWAAAASAQLLAQEAVWQVVPTIDDTFTFWVLKDGVPVMNSSMYGWGPGWGGLPGGAAPTSTGLGAAGVLDLQAPWCNDVATALHASVTADGALAYRYTLTSGHQLPVLMLEAGLSLTPPFQGGQLSLCGMDGVVRSFPIPWPRTELPTSERIKEVRLQIANAGEVVVSVDPPLRLHRESNNLRFALAADALPPGTTTATLTYHFPGKLVFSADPASVAGFVKPVAGPTWYPLQVRTDPASPEPKESVTDMSSWLDAPAGRHGGVRIDGDHFALADGTPIKFWGTNLAYAGGCAPTKPWAEATALRFARFGINAVRLHKFTDPAGADGVSDPQDATKLLPAGLDRLDYLCSQLAGRGIYYGFSHTYVFRVMAGNAARLLDYQEILRNSPEGSTYGMINYAEDVQDLLIERAVGILTHRNPYSKTTYARDPALAYFELQNEDDIFFWTSGDAIDERRWPHYVAALRKRFAAFLGARYRTQEALAAAWKDSLHADELLKDGTVHIQGNPWFFTATNLNRIGAGERQRMLDNAAFLHQVQDEFYRRYVAAVRATGYTGPICGSPWQAPAMLPAYYNLLSDAACGYVDRHNYSGGSLEASLLAEPGSGYIGTGLQRVQGHPFGISEWCHCYPSLYSAEGPALFAVYGMGLQDWNASFEFQSSSDHLDYANEVGHPPWGVWNADLPSQLGQAVTLARMIYRGDVTPGAVVSVRHAREQDIAEDHLDFSDDIAQSGDVKTFSGSCPPAGLAVGRCLVDLSDQGGPSTFPSLKDFTTGTVLHSTTHQLAWDTAGRGCISVDTPGTKAVVGFAQDRVFTLGAVSIQLQCPFASVVLTARGRNETLDHASSAVLSALARASNPGCTYCSIDQRIIANGGGGVLLEPVKATIRITRPAISAVNILDHAGCRTGRTLPVVDGAFTIDGAREQAFYYEVVFAR